MVKNKLYLNRIFYHLLVVVFLECILCNPLSACCSAKKTKVQKKITSQADQDRGAFFYTSFYVCSTGLPYIHDLYCKNKGFFYKFFLQQYTTSRTYYLCWTLFEHVLKKLTGVVWIYKTWKDLEFYYGSVIGMGWYPQCLKFNKFSVGFFDMFVNLTSSFMCLCHFFCHQYFKECSKDFGYSLISSDVFNKEYEVKKLSEYKEMFDNMNYFLYLKKDISSIYKPCCLYMQEKGTLCLVEFIFLLFFDFSLINIKTYYGLKIKILTLQQVLKFLKRRACRFISNMSKISKSNISDGLKKVFIYRYSYHSHFFFGERDSIFLLLLELFIPSIEICLNHDNF